jgi:signal transduction histidine kinase
VIRILSVLIILSAVVVPDLYAQALPLAPAPETREVSPPPDAEAGLPFYLEHYAPRDYNAQFQNWAVTQDDRGVIYVGNLSGVLEFDGASWRLIRTATDAWVRSLASDDDGTVYVGAWGDIGYLAADDQGMRRFQSLIAEVPPSERGFEDVWGTHATQGGIFFQTSDRILRWDGESMRVWGGEEARKFHTSFRVREQFFVRETGTGLWTHRNDSLVIAPGGEFFADVPIYMMVPYDAEHTLIGTRKQGFFLYDGTTLRPFATEVDALVAEHRLYHGTALPGGHFALATLGGGVLIIDRKGRLVRVLDQRSNVPDSFVNHVYADHQGGLWMALNNSGVARVDSPSQLTRFDRDLGLEGIIYNIERHRGRLYVGTGAGLFYLKQHPVRPGDAPRSRFLQVPDMPSVWSIVSIQGDLLVATEEGVYRLDGKGWEQLSTLQSFRLAPSRSSGRIYVGTSQGVQVLERTAAGWTVQEPYLVNLGEEVRSIREQDRQTLWLGGLEGGVARVRLTSDGRVSGLDRYGAEQGLPHHSIHVGMIQGEMVFKTLEGVFAFRPDEGERGRFVPDRTFLPPQHGSQSDSLLAIVEDQAGDVWVVHHDHIDIGRRAEGGSYVFEAPPVLRFPKVGPVQIFAEPDGVVWISNGNELLRYNTNVQKPYEAPFHSVIREVVDLNDQFTLFGGAVGEDVTAQLTEAGIPYRRNTLQFEVAASSYNNPLATRFQYYLEGADSGWSDWTAQARRTYTSLREGTYRLRVRARNQQGVVSEEAMLTFRVLPPWYRTWWAYLAYLIGLVAGAVLFVRYRVIVAENKAARKQAEELALERRLNARLKEANERLRQANKLKDEFLANTSHELRTPLTAILGFTSVLQEELEGEHGEFLGLINANGQRLLHTVNSLLDLAKIRAGIVTLSSEKVDAAGQVQEMSRMLQPLAQEKDLYLTVEGPDLPVFARLDPHYFDRILYNLIGNAIKFTDEGGVTVEVEHDAATLTVHVRDTGVGIDDTFIPHLFEAFKQESSGLGRLHEGSGLGLAITAHLIDLMEGEIEVESRKGEGSVFTVTLPRNTMQAEPVAPVQA